MASQITARWLPESQPEKDAVLEQLQRLFDHPAFKHSRRSQALLRYVVEHHLQDGNCELKERTLGIEVFGREPDYDTSSDPVVRNTASEVRKRIAQYYNEFGHEKEIRLDLPIGSYVPEFHPPSAARSEATFSPEVPIISVAHPIAENNRGRAGWTRYAISAGLLTAFVGLAAWGALRGAKATRSSFLSQFWTSTGSVHSAGTTGGSSAKSAFSQFWGPVVSSTAPVQICVGTMFALPPSLAASLRPTAQEAPKRVAMLPWHDLLASYRLTGFLGGRGRAYQLENAKTITINDLTRGPVVLVGAFDNPWTIDLTGSLRFHFMKEGRAQWIADRKNPSKQYVKGPGNIPGSTHDYAIIGRFLSSSTGQMSVVLGGIGSPGTIAATDFATNPHDMAELAGQLPKDWQSKNLEALISVETINGEPGAPSIQAVEVW